MPPLFLGLDFLTFKLFLDILLVEFWHFFLTQTNLSLPA